jgi:hypothetical protein
LEELPWKPDIYIENITGEILAYSRVEVKVNDNGEAIVTERRRSRGVFIENLELEHFPFDVQVFSMLQCILKRVNYCYLTIAV